MEDAVRSGQLLLISTGFDGMGQALALGSSAEDRQLAGFLTEQLAAYNAGGLCR